MTVGLTEIAGLNTSWMPLLIVAVICATTVLLTVVALRKKGPDGRIVIRSPFATIELDSGNRTPRDSPARKKPRSR
ncbi:hypothetical protein [Nocardia sp. NPDC048505]|uniref:hypothetical protein n=1 Tax=unclassified Nocardia TaxID=2637762 RepID=UPI0033D29269